MKTLKHISTALLLLLAMTVTAQQGINYKAIIKDGSGNVVASTSITVQFIIYKGAALTNNVYQESHTVNTDANGIVIVNIGEGTPISGVFSTIDWASDAHFLNVQVNTGAGLVDLGTTEFKAVPYALSAGNVTGLEKITENTTGWRLKGQDPNNYGNIGDHAVDLSYSALSSATRGATGSISTAMGLYTIASGNFSTAMGESTAAIGTQSTAMGLGTKADAFASTAMGMYNIGGGSPSSSVSTDPLFEIGNGTNTSSLSNALTILKNGTITAPSLTNTLITTAGAKALITKEYADANLISSGLEKITEGANTGWQLVGKDPANYGDIGNNAVNLSFNNSASTTRGASGSFSTAMGARTIASGFISTAMGASTIASGESSTAMGNTTIASGQYSTAIGLFSVASGNASTAMGNVAIAVAGSSTAMGYSTRAEGVASTAIGDNTTASGDKSTSMGEGTSALSLAETSIGSYNTTYTIGTNGDYQWNPTDRLFTIGNGTSAGFTSNALTVLKNGNTDVNGVFRATKNVWPTTGAGVEIAYDATQNRGYVQCYNRDTAFWNQLFLGASGVSPVTDNFTWLGTPTNRWLKVYAVNGTIQTSDRRMKKDIKNLNYGLHTLMQLRPVSYRWKKGNQDLNLGLIAQEVQKLIPEVIDVGDDDIKTLGMKYTELIPVLINAIQEQQGIIENQKTVNQQQSAKLTIQNKDIEKLAQRLDRIENAHNKQVVSNK